MNNKEYIPPESECDFQKKVIIAANLNGWMVEAVTKARQMKDGQDVYRTPFIADGVGFPDLFMAKEGCYPIMAELKSERGKLSVAQEVWMMVLKKSLGIRYFVWRPSDWDSIVEILKERE